MSKFLRQDGKVDSVYIFNAMVLIVGLIYGGLEIETTAVLLLPGLISL